MFEGTSLTVGPYLVAYGGYQVFIMKIFGVSKGRKNKVLLAITFFHMGIKHVFSCINIRQVPWEVLKTEANTSQGTWRMLMH